MSTGSVVAQPFAAAMAAEMGAEVIQIERPGHGGDVWRRLEFPLPVENGDIVAAGWVQMRRNCLHATLDLSKPKGRELFLEMIPKFDIWMESSIPGSYDAWGLDDATVQKANPKLVITHVSGYGQYGHPDYLARASYDFIGQAFGGMMNLTGFPDPDPPVRAAPWTGDFITALFCLWSTLAGYINGQRTGRGQVIDLAQYEEVHQVLAGTMVAYNEIGLNRERSGNAAGLAQPYDSYQASDGWVVIAAVGNVFDRVCGVLDLGPVDPYWRPAATEVDSPVGIEFDAILRGWVLEHTVAETMEIMNSVRVGCCSIMTPKDMDEDPHYQARDVHIEWDDISLGRRVKGVGITPKFSETPGQIWRGSVPMGHDNHDIYKKYLGLAPSEVDQLKDQGIV